ncbi:hypothetical protein GCM10011390_06190 [Aureimonas endophytica]|uniref:Uncharacterized protein n=1 Tax=Aureimonas endophytica TaxID=2027858 RepID=A0A917E085_9HYPH|nr:hypothetical protein [Aureimonas endophytica]GGD90171.1 hypothetical protein GCM10011390_06190 [Aureimonas endophytica]
MNTKLLLASAMSLCLFGGAALAQSQTPPPPPAPPAAAPKDDARMAAPDAGDDDQMGPAGDEDMADMPPPPPPGGPRDHGPGPKGPRHGMGPRGMMPPPPPPSKAAHFRIQNGPFRFDVKCADDEPMQACADIAAKMLDQAKSLPLPPPPPAR